MTAQHTLMLGAAACAALLAAGQATLARAANEADCRNFHQECVDARAIGYRDAGICSVERLECATDPTDAPEAGIGKRPQAAGARPEGRDDRERSIGP